MAFQDSDASWVGYPGLPQEVSTSVVPVRLSRSDRVSSGDFRITNPSALRGVRITVVHNPLTRAEADTLQSFYETRLGQRFQFLYHGDLKIYDCGFIQQPKEEWLGSGVDGSGVWRVTSTLDGILFTG